MRQREAHVEEEGQRKAGCWGFSWALKEAPSLSRSLQSQTSSWLLKRTNAVQEKSPFQSVEYATEDKRLTVFLL